MTSIDYIKELKNLYRSNELNILKQNKPLPLHQFCDNHRECWGRDRVGASRVPEYPGITYPHIGKKYNFTRFLAIGVNHRANWEGEVNICSERNGIIKVSENIRKGKISVRIYKYLAIYATILLTRMGYISGPVSRNIVNSKILADSLEHHIAWHQAIKCNPRNQVRDYPYSRMFDICPDHILKKELEILKPRCILIFGKDLFETVPNLLAGMGYEIRELANKNDGRIVRRWIASRKYSKVGIIGVYHPQFFHHPRYEGDFCNIVVNFLKKSRLPCL